ncbi:MAG: KH domain-containing protein [Candidatus Levybacteria bacterium]|nr:KH domain-containing protein [Candidatus Levybacteria bacterium]MBI4098235.1 KH domain-containing protein [Candidatus Levybacteria bacterium]
MKDALNLILTSIVDKPEEVEIKEEEQDGFITFTLRVAKEDMGKVIGKEGKVIRAIRNVIKIPAIKQNKKVQVNLEEFS